MKRITSILLSVFLVVGTMMGTSIHGETTTSSRYAPIIEVEEQKPVVIYTGTQNTLVYTLVNETPYDAKNLSVIPDVSMADMVGFRLMNTSFQLSDRSLSDKSPVTIQVEVVVDDTVTEGVYPIKLLLTYDNTSRDHYSREIMTYFEVRDDPTQKERVMIGNNNASTIQVIKGDTVTFSYQVKNDEGYRVANVKTYIKGLPAAYFALQSTKDTITLGNVDRYITKDVAIDYHVSEDLPGGSYPYEIVLTYENEFGNKILRSSAYNLFVSDGSSNDKEVTLGGLVYPISVGQDMPFTVGFDVANSGDDVIEDVMITMTSNDVFMPKSPTIIKVDRLEVGDVYKFSAELVATGDSLSDRNYPLAFSVTYNDGKDDVTNTQVMGVYVKSKDQDDDAVGNAPKMIISEYKSEPQIVKAGSEFDLHLDFMNTNQSKTIYNVKAYITANESTEDTGNVFTPVGSSNTFYIDQIGPKGASQQAIKLFTVPDAAPKTYTITINFEYEDKEGTPYTATEYVGIPVTQVTKVEASDFNIPMEVMAGEGVNIYFDIFNTGKAKVYNLLVKAEGNFTSDPVSRYIGNFEAGSSDYFDAYVNFQEPGPLDGKFVISYEDAVGEPYVIEKEFSLNVTEAYMPEFNGENGFDPDEITMPDQGISSQMPKIIAGGLGGIILVCLMVFILKKRKKRKGMELNFDEDD